MRKSLERTLDYAMIGAYAAFHVALAFFHEPWEDEAQAWLIARDVPLHDFPRIMSYEGTPGLWHLLLMPLARLGFPYWTETALNLCIAVALAYVIVRYSPFSRPFKALLLLSGLLGFEYVTYARSYMLGALLLFLVAAWYERRFERPWIYALLVALLANADLFTLYIAACVGLVYGIECLWQRRWKLLLPLGVMLLGGGLALAQLWPRPGAALDRLAFVNFDNAAQALNMAMFPWITGIAEGYLVLAGLVVLVAALWSMRRSPAALMITLVAGLAISATFVYVQIPEIRRAGHLVLLLIFALWISGRAQAAAAGDKPSRRALKLTGFMLAVSVFPLFVVMVPQEIDTLSSGGRDLARYIATTVPPDAVIVAHPEMATESALPYLPGRSFWRVYRHAFGTYTQWDSIFISHSPFGADPERILADIQGDFAGKPRPYLLVDHELRNPAAYGYSLAYKTAGAVVGRGSGESFFLYKPLQY